MEFRLLGPLEVWDGQRPVAIHGAKERALLACLLLDANRVVSSDRLVDELWGEDPPESARKSLQVRVSNLRKALRPAGDVLRSTGGGYVVRVGPDELDLDRFERLLAEAEDARARGEPALAVAKLRDALALWRGPALADVVSDTFGRAAAGRLEELRLVALERRIEAQLELGGHVEAVAELEALVARHPYRERLRALLMLALYRSGRQAEALGAYREARRELVGELGIEPGPGLHGLEQAMLRQDPTLDLAAVAAPERAILVAALDTGALPSLVAVATALARRPAHELIVVQPVARGADVAAAAAHVTTLREELAGDGLTARAAAFSAARPYAELVRIAAEHEVDLLLLDGGPETLADPDLTASPCDVAVLVVRAEPFAPGTVLVPFTGAEQDWAAVELAAWLARASGSALRLAGPDDASRVIAHASLAAQRALGVAAEPLLVPPTGEELIRAAADAALVVLGFSARLGPVRLDVVRRARPPALLVRRGLRPGGLAPRASLTRFTWSVRP
jgi:DNA-binding SARP family transcriptional activator